MASPCNSSTIADIAFITLGCAKNEVDSNHMRAALAAAGYREVDEPQQADVVLVNTCAFITEATEEAIEVILDILALDNVLDGRAKVVVCGCLPARYGSELDSELPEVDLFVPAVDEPRIAELLDKLLASARPHRQRCKAGGSSAQTDSLLSTAHGQNREFCPSICTDEFAAPPELAVCKTHDFDQGMWGTAQLASDPPAFPLPADVALPAALPFNRIVEAPWAYVKISDGCSRCCAFCTIPSIRGPYRSIAYPQIDAEICGLVARGVREIILIGQDTGIWGHDLRRGELCSPVSADNPADPRNLAQLLNHLAGDYPDTWLRVMYLQPGGLNDDLLQTMAAHDNICNYLDIPLQHANATILKQMNRAGCGAEYLQMLQRIRAALPGVALRTTLIAGFPGETRAQAAELQRFIEDADFDYAGVFVYSPEAGTPAGERADQVPTRTRRARAQRIRDIADQLGFARAAQGVGSTSWVLICGQDEQGIWGRTQQMAPDVDGVVYVENADADAIGSIVEVEITDAACYDLFAHWRA